MHIINQVTVAKMYICCGGLLDTIKMSENMKNIARLSTLQRQMLQIVILLPSLCPPTFCKVSIHL